jgi:membrane glycosyltransferase
MPPFIPPAQLRRDRAVAAAVTAGPSALNDRQKLMFLTDPVALSQLHFEVWTSPVAHPTWFAARSNAGCDQDGALRQAF